MSTRRVLRLAGAALAALTVLGLIAGAVAASEDEVIDTSKEVVLGVSEDGVIVIDTSGQPAHTVPTSRVEVPVGDPPPVGVDEHGVDLSASSSPVPPEDVEDHR